MFEYGLADVLMDTLAMTESPILVKKTLWAIANILHDSKESYIKITVDNGGEILARCIDLLFSINDPVVHLSAMNVLNVFVQNCFDDQEIQKQILMTSWRKPDLLKGLFLRGLKSCNNSYRTLEDSL